MFFLGAERPILSTSKCKDGRSKHLLDCGFGLTMWAPEGVEDVGARTSPDAPHILVVDNFYRDPDAVRAFALEQPFEEAPAVYKGLRTPRRYLWPHLKEDFERLLHVEITDWLRQPANGAFQQTVEGDPLVYHADTQDYAAAIYLTPDAPWGSGTSFWAHRSFECRRSPMHPFESPRWPTPSLIHDAVFTHGNLLGGDAWKLVDQVGAVYNRLVIWDAKLIHSATSYAGFSSENPRLVQLFFFSVRRQAGGG